MSIAKMLGGLATAAGLVAGTAPAHADPDAAGADPNPFATLHCGCREVAPADSADPRDEIKRGIREGLSAWVPGLPPPTH